MPRWFRIAYAENAVRRHLADLGEPLEGLRIGSVVTAMTGFYREARAQHAHIPNRGDGLAWQWGPDADGERYTAAVTRQLIRDGDDQPIVQVTLCLAYRWTPRRREVGRGSVWCFDPADLDGFEREVRRSRAFRAVASATPVEVLLRTDTL